MTITANMTGVVKHKSKKGGLFYYLFFKEDNGKSWKSCIYPHYANWKNWQDIIESGKLYKLDHLKIKSYVNSMIDADSRPEVLLDLGRITKHPPQATLF